MKTKAALCAVFLALAASAHAATIATSTNKAGGSIELTNEPCTLSEVPDKSARLMFSRRPSGETLIGCYLLGDRYVMARYAGDRQLYTYEPEGFTLLKPAETPVERPMRRPL